MGMNQASFVCPHCNQQRLFQSTPMNHTPHLLAAIFLCGLYLPIWILIAIGYQDVWRCAFCGHSDALKYLQNPRLREYEAVAAEQKRILDAQRAEERRLRLAAMPQETFGEKVTYLWTAYPAAILIAGGAIGCVLLFTLIGVVNSFTQPAGVSTSASRSTTAASPTPYATPYLPTNLKSGSAPKLTPIPATPTKTKTAMVITENANLRSTPDNFGDIISTVSTGSTVEIIKQKGPWFQVKASGTVGWMHGNTIQLQ
jgi:hypothetical protein